MSAIAYVGMIMDILASVRITVFLDSFEISEVHPKISLTQVQVS